MALRFFISHSKSDREIAKLIADTCDSLGVATFLDEKDVSWGESITDSVGRGLSDCNHLLLVLSPASLKSNWVFYEVGRATERGMTILPFLTHEAIEVPGFIGDRLRIVGLDALKRQIEIFNVAIQELTEDLVNRLARLPTAVQKLDVSEKAKKALEPCVNVVLREHRQHLNDLERGELAVRGPEMFRVFQHFCEAAGKSFRALSNDDLSWWASTESRNYLNLNQTLLDRRLAVERVFVLPRGLKLKPELFDAISRQIRLGITVRIAYLDQCQEIVETNRELDFGLFDDFAVSFFRFSAGRIYRISTSRADCQYYTSLFDRVVEACEQIPGKSGRQSQIFDSDDQLRRFFEISELGKGGAVKT